MRAGEREISRILKNIRGLRLMSNRGRKNLAQTFAAVGFGFVTLLSGRILPAQQAGGVTPSGSQVRLVRSVVGSKGEQRNGSFVMTEPRSMFYVPEDREVIVYFEWEGAKGTHHCEGSVRGRAGSLPPCRALITSPRNLALRATGRFRSQRVLQVETGFLKAGWMERSLAN
jgi:hypothetical protein